LIPSGSRNAALHSVTILHHEIASDLPAVPALMENVRVSAFAKFVPADGIKSKLDTEGLAGLEDLDTAGVRPPAREHLFAIAIARRRSNSRSSPDRGTTRA
jgi:hypothetical protein